MHHTSAFAVLAGLLVVSGSSPASPPLIKRVTVAPEVTLRVVEAGRPSSRPPVVFIPGWSSGADIWGGQIQRFGAAGRVIAFDPRSQGQSTTTWTGNTPEQRADDLHALLAAEHVARPVLVAWSQAVQDVAAYVMKYGTRDLGGIVFVDAAISKGADGIAAQPADAAAQFSRFAYYVENQSDYLRRMYGFIITKPLPAGLVDQLIATGMKTPSSIGISMLVADMFAQDRTPALAKIDCPVLILAAGSSGDLSQQQTEAMVIKKARFNQIPDSGHAVFLDQPDQFADALAEFLKVVDMLPRQPTQ